MTLLAPGFLVAAFALSVGVLAIHYIAWRRPDDAMLPTARFLPEDRPLLHARASRPTDLVLLLIRVALLLVAGLALSRPVFTPPRRGTTSVIVIDRSRALASAAAALSALPAEVPGVERILVAFDSTAARLDAARDLAPALAPRDVRGSLSAALVEALREAARLAPRRQRVEITLVSPLVREELDAASMAIRARWPDSIRIVRVAAARAVVAATTPDVRVDAQDAVSAGIALARANGYLSGGAAVRVVRDAPTPDDSTWVRGGARVLVHWPLASSVAPGRGVAAPGAASAHEMARGVLAGDVAVLGALVPLTLANAGTPVAWWLDGQPAARQVTSGAGCVRTVGFSPPEDGDLALTPAFQRVAAYLLAPCGGAVDLEPVAEGMVQALAAPVPRESGAGAIRTAPLRASLSSDRNLPGAVLMAIAFLLGVVEWRLRRRPRDGTVSPGRAP